MNAKKALQLSSELTWSARQHVEPHILYSHIIPIFWGDESGSISELQAVAFRSSVYRWGGHTLVC